MEVRAAYWTHPQLALLHGWAAAELGYHPLQSVALSVHSRSLTRLCQSDPGWLTI